jgi:hypothetical protein
MCLSQLVALKPRSMLVEWTTRFTRLLPLARLLFCPAMRKLNTLSWLAAAVVVVQPVAAAAGLVATDLL